MNNSGKYNGKLNVVGNTLKQKRIENKISLEALSNKLLLKGLNIPVTSLHRIENNQRTVRDYELCILANVLNINVLDLLIPFLDSLDK